MRATGVPARERPRYRALMSVPKGGAVVHLIAELTGISSAQLHDAALLGGLLIAAAGAAGLHATAPPMLRSDALRGVDALRYRLRRGTETEVATLTIVVGNRP